MTLSEIQKKARSLGIRDTWKYSKKELIRLIQSKEGNVECFATTANATCGQEGCCWRVDCLK